MKAVLIAALAALLAAPSQAANFKTEITDLEGVVVQDCVKLGAVPNTCEKYAPLTLGRVSAGALNTVDVSLSTVDIARRGMLAIKLYEADELQLNAADTKLVCDLIAKRGYAPIVVYRAIKLLDPASIKE